jgi:hypothetical protein
MSLLPVCFENPKSLFTRSIMKFLPFVEMVVFPLVGVPSCWAGKENTRFRYAKQTQTSRNQNNLQPLVAGLFD